MRLGIPTLFLLVAFTDPFTGASRIEEARSVSFPERGEIVIDLCDGTRLSLPTEAFYPRRSFTAWGSTTSAIGVWTWSTR